MSNSHYALDLAKLVVVAAIILSMFAVNITFAQSINTDNRHQQPGSGTQNLTTRPLPENPPDLNRPPRTIHRVGTAIGARNSISIKSTDAGIIHRQPPASGCINCGIIDFVNKIGQGNGLNAIAGGIVAGTVAREVFRYAPYPHGANHPNPMGGAHGEQGGNMANPGNQYHIGITMNDGSQATITLPDAANFHQGDKVKLIDGVLVPDR